MSELVSIVITTYNYKCKVDDAILSAVKQSHNNVKVIVVDDGSTDGTVEHLKDLSLQFPDLDIILLKHGERGLARKAGIDRSREFGSDYLLFIDDDMMLDHFLIEKSLKYFRNYETLGALVIPERPYTLYTNFYSKVKVFERGIINNAGKKVGKNSIEAARFWLMRAYDESGGINPNEISFEETQPTIRYRDSGGYILRAVETYLNHDEKEATLKGLLSKKYYYFNQMSKTFKAEEQGLKKALTRWYFFRPVLYRFTNIIKVFRHPILALGMFYMYLCLSFIGVVALVRRPRE